MEEVAPETFTVKARIHDHKSPNMPQDWKSVVLLINDQEVPLNWYGENLWKATIGNQKKTGKWQICATDAAGNKTCADVIPD
jgi:hypothetical protein